MRVFRLKIPKTFKRFGSLEITGLGPEVELVVMLGPNGSGKSSVFDALLVWARQTGRRPLRRFPNESFSSEGGLFGTPQIELHPSPGTSRPRPQLHVRTAHRNTPDVLSSSVKKQKKFDQDTRLDRMIETDRARLGTTNGSQPVSSRGWRTWTVVAQLRTCSDRTGVAGQPDPQSATVADGL